MYIQSWSEPYILHRAETGERKKRPAKFTSENLRVGSVSGVVLPEGSLCVTCISRSNE